MGGRLFFAHPRRGGIYFSHILGGGGASVFCKSSEENRGFEGEENGCFEGSERDYSLITIMGRPFGRRGGRLFFAHPRRGGASIFRTSSEGGGAYFLRTKNQNAPPPPVVINERSLKSLLLAPLLLLF